MNKLTKILVVVVAVVFVLSIGKNFLVKAAVENGVRLATGLPLQMKSLKVGILDTSLRIKGLKVLNPSGFEEKTMLSMPEITVDYHLRDIIGGKIHLETVVIDMEEFNVVTNKDGELNLNALKLAEEGEEKKKEKKPEAEPKEKGKAPEFQIDNLTLRIGKMSFKNFSKKKPTSNEFDLNLDESYENISSPQALVALVFSKALMKAPLAMISGMDLGGFQDNLTNAVGDLNKLAGESLDVAKEKAQEALKAAEALKDSVDLDKLKDSVSVDKMKDLGAGSLDKMKGLGSSSLAKLKGAGGSVTDGAGAAADSAKESAAKALSSLKGLVSKSDQ